VRELVEVAKKRENNGKLAHNEQCQMTIGEAGWVQYSVLEQRRQTDITPCRSGVARSKAMTTSHPNYDHNPSLISMGRQRSCVSATAARFGMVFQRVLSAKQVTRHPLTDPCIMWYIPFKRMTRLYYNRSSYLVDQFPQRSRPYAQLRVHVSSNLTYKILEPFTTTRTHSKSEIERL
jgi:hypothetical protein